MSSKSLAANLAEARLHLEGATNAAAFLAEASASLMAGDDEVSDPVLAGYRLLSDAVIERLWKAVDSLEEAAHVCR